MGFAHPRRAIDKKLATGEFDALTLIHNETSTGVMSPLAEIAALKKKYPDVMFIVDAVSSLTALPIKFDELGIDVLLAGTQKAFALPPGSRFLPLRPPRSRKRRRPKIAVIISTSSSSRKTRRKA